MQTDPRMAFWKEKHLTKQQSHIFENIDHPPRCWMVERARTLDYDTQRQIVRSGAFEPLREALLNPLPDQPTTESLTVGKVEITRRTSDRLWLKSSAPGSGLVVISEAWCPGWWARVNNVLTPVLSVDGILRGVRVPAGENEIYLRYVPDGLKVGLIISALGSAGIVAWILVGWWQNRKTARQFAHFT